jgi:hypothetical protein
MKTVTRLIGLVTLLLVVSGFGFSSRAPQAWDDWAASNEADVRVIDHSAWSGLLASYVKPGKDGLNRFAYGKVSPSDRQALKSYIDTLSRVGITSFNRREQLAYWLNLYNAVTVQVILDHYPVKSIRDIDISGFLKNGPWQKELVSVEETPLTLDNIEHDILRPIWRDPRIHYGVNCASVGCPNLMSEAFTSANVDALLNANARAYVNSPRGVLVKANGEISVSSIYSWFAHDFGNSEAAVMSHLLEYAGDDLAAQLRKANSLTDTHYDWALNE